MKVRDNMEYDNMRIIQRYRIMQEFLAYGSIGYIECEIGIGLTKLHLEQAKGDPNLFLQHNSEARKYQKGLEKKLCINFGKVLE